MGFLEKASNAYGMKKNIASSEISRLICSFSLQKGTSRPWNLDLLEIESIVDRMGTYGILFRYEFPNREGCSFEIKRRDINEPLSCILTTENDQIVLNFDKTKKRDEFLDAAHKLEQAMRDGDFSFAPAYYSGFGKEILSRSVGERVILNSGMEIACIKKEGDELTFRAVCDGSLSNINISNFLSSKKFHISKNNTSELQKLYCHAYDARIQTSYIRTRISNEDGISILNKLEQEAQSKHTFFVGDCKLHCIKADGKCTWYDGNYKHIPKETVASVFGWAKNTIAFVGNVNENGFFEPVPKPSKAHFEKLNSAAFSKNAYAFMEEAFSYSKEQSSPLYASTSGIIQNKNGNFAFETYVFDVNEDGTRQIAKVSYENGDANGLPVSIDAVSEEEFLAFYNEKFEAEITKIKSASLPMIENYIEISGQEISEVSKGIALDLITEETLKKAKEKGLCNPLGLKEKNYNNVRIEVQKLISDYLKEGKIDSKLLDEFKISKELAEGEER